jgi:exosortase A
MIMAASVLLILGLFWDAAVSMAATWQQSATFTHGFLIVPLSLYLLWTRRHRVTALFPTPNRWGWLLLLVCGWGWLLGHLADIVVLQQLALVAMVPGLVWTVLGPAVVRALRLPFACLCFAVPMGESLEPLLQDFLAVFTVTALQLSGIPVLWEGRFFTTPSGSWVVAEACSGVRYVIPAVVLGSLYAALTYQRWSRRLGFLLIAVTGPILANGVRAYGIVVLTHLGETSAVAALAAGVVHRMWGHLLYGWLMFGGTIALLFWLGLRWREPEDQGSANDRPRFPPSPGQTQSAVAQPCSARLLLLMASSGVGLLALAPLAAPLLTTRPELPGAVQAAAPAVAPPWQPLTQYSGDWVPHFVGADATVTQSYVADAQPVHVYTAYYTHQRQGAEVINTQNVLVDGEQWTQIAAGHTRTIVDGQWLAVHETHLRSSRGTARLVWHWYWVGGAFTARPSLAKVLQLKARLLGGPPAAAVIALAIDYTGHQTEAARTLQYFLEHTSLLATLQSFSR